MTAAEPSANIFRVRMSLRRWRRVLMGGLARTMTEVRPLRSVALPAYRLGARAMVFGSGPRVLVNGMPKTGTHLVATLLRSFPGVRFSGRHHALREFEAARTRSGSLGESWDLDWDRLRKALAGVNRGQFMTAHFAPVPRLIAMLGELDFRTIAVLRDPRDVAVSSAFYITSHPRHFLHRRFNTELTSTGERLMAVIRGLPPTDEHRGLGDVGSRIERYRPWLERPDVYICRFESLVGPRGGGDGAAQRQTIHAIADAIEKPLSERDVTSLVDKVWSPSSATFRKGAIGDWRNHFGEEHRAAFKELAGPQLIALGYERDLDW